MKKSKLSVITKELKSNTLNILIISVSSILITLMIYLLGGVHIVIAHIMYIPIIYSARVFKIPGGIIMGIAGGLLLGPFMPLDTQTDMHQELFNWVFRLGSFTFVGAISGYFFYSYHRVNKTHKLLLENVSDGICVVDSQGVVSYQNKMFTSYIETLHLDRNDCCDFTGKKLIDLYSGFSKKKYFSSFKHLRRAIIDGVTVKNYYIELDIDGCRVLVEHSVNPIIQDSRYTGSVVTVKDFESKSNYEKRIQTMNHTDSLTGLKNRSYIEEFAKSLPDDSLPQGYFVVDVDNLKFINDSFGHLKGDELILKVSYIISTAVKQYGTTARLDGDEFLIVIPNATVEVMDMLMTRIQKEVNNYQINNLNMSVSCGYYLLENNEVSVEQAISNAEKNMYLDKNTSYNPLKNNSVNVIINTLHEKDVYSEQHSTSVSAISKRLAEAYGLPKSQVTEIWNAALLHDIGKIIVPNTILNKPCRLTDEEFSMMQQHPAIGYRLLSQMNGMDDISKIVLSHHERYDGKGYPNGIKKDEIPLGSRIISVADSFDAITTTRPYRSKRSNEEALQELSKCSGTQFDPNIIKVFVKKFDTIIK